MFKQTPLTNEKLQALQKQHDFLMQEKTRCEQALENVINQLSETERNIAREQNSLLAARIVTIPKAIGDIDSSRLSDEEKQLIQQTIHLRELVKTKFQVTWGSANLDLLDKQHISIFFHQSELLMSKEEVKYDEKCNDKLEEGLDAYEAYLTKRRAKPHKTFPPRKVASEDAVNYFKALGCRCYEKVGLTFQANQVVELPVSQLNDAIHGLNLLTSPTPDEIDQRQRATITMKC